MTENTGKNSGKNGEKNGRHGTPPGHDDKGGKKRAVAKGPDGKKLGPKAHDSYIDPGRDNDPALKSPEYVGEDQTKTTTTN